MTKSVPLAEAAASLTQLVAELGAGDEIVLTEGERPVARLVGPASIRKRPPPGLMRGALEVIAEDDEHLEDFREYME